MRGWLLAAALAVAAVVGCGDTGTGPDVTPGVPLNFLAVDTCDVSNLGHLGAKTVRLVLWEDTAGRVAYWTEVGADTLNPQTVFGVRCSVREFTKQHAADANALARANGDSIHSVTVSGGITYVSISFVPSVGSSLVAEDEDVMVQSSLFGMYDPRTLRALDIPGRIARYAERTDLFVIVMPLMSEKRQSLPDLHDVSNATR